jgi:transposase-like protein
MSEQGKEESKRGCHNQIDTTPVMLYNNDKLKMTGGFDMKQIKTLEEALNRIAELEKENAELREELEYLRKRKASGRQKHNAKWMAIYNDFVVCYEKGMTVVEIAERNGISERSMYRYKAYYEKLQKESQKS